MPLPGKGSEFDRFHAAHKYAKYTPAFNHWLEGLMGDIKLTLDRRLDPCALRLSFGNHSEFLCLRFSEEKKDPVSAAFCAREIKFQELVAGWRGLHPELLWRRKHPEIERWAPMGDEQKEFRAEAEAHPVNVRSVENYFRREVNAGRMRAEGHGMGRVLFLLAEPLVVAEQAPLETGVTFEEIVSAWRVEDPRLALEFDAAGELRERVRHMLLARYRVATRSEANGKAPIPGAGDNRPPAPRAKPGPHKIKDARALNIKQKPIQSVSQSEKDRPTDNHGDQAEKMQAFLLEPIPSGGRAPARSLPEKLPDETPQLPLCLKIVSTLGETPWELLGFRIHKRWDAITSYGMVLDLAKDVREAWDKGAPSRREPEAGEGTQDAQRQADIIAMLQDTYNDPRTEPDDRMVAAEQLRIYGVVVDDRAAVGAGVGDSRPGPAKATGSYPAESAYPKPENSHGD